MTNSHQNSHQKIREQCRRAGRILKQASQLTLPPVTLAKAARRWHVEAEGYDPQDVQATLVLRIPKHIAAPIGWPEHELLRALGAVVLCERTPRVVRIGQTIYQEGGMDGVLNRLAEEQREAVEQERADQTPRLI
jgi:hypothetical protein